MRTAKLCILLVIVFFSEKSYAQLLIKKESLLNHENRKSVGIIFGTLGVGLNFSYRCTQNKRLYLNGALTYIGYRKLIDYDYNAKTIIKINPDISMGHADLGIQYEIFKKSPVFLFGGISHFLGSKYAAKINTETGFDTKDLVLSSEDFGEIDFEIKWNKYNPYLGVGFGRPVSHKKVGFICEVGTYYIGSPKLYLNYTGVLSFTNIDEILPKIEHNMSGYAFLPYLRFNVNYCF
ncbi:hypothetical protein LV89_03445 [Arcicella aurantiaca]|uniref:Outer membrane protein with beta-barrel domain n=1 Tax=Arcicella aurantiaca TaxID=591202 RepID=A0A316EHB9_9BACT|nr:hypothetical protein [Arcicella aurantiaca]PWK22380.1 hypothetical protein LV89_03445 [Arcicella aurantiaca]